MWWLRARADFVIVDVPTSCAEATATAAIHASIVERADRILIATAPDVVGLRRTSLLAAAIASRPGGSDIQPRMSLVLNRYRKANNADTAEIAAVLRLTVAATIPDGASRGAASCDRGRRRLVGARMCPEPRLRCALPTYNPPPLGASILGPHV